MVQLNFLANAIIVGSMYALVAIGLTLIYSVGGIFNLAHGVNVAIGAWVTYYLGSVIGLNIWIALLAAILIAGLFSLSLYWGMIRRIQDSPVLVMTVTLLIEIVSEYYIRTTVGIQTRAVPPLLPGNVDILGVTVETNLLLAIVLAWVLILSVFWFIDRTKLGKAVEATSMSEKGPALVGINRQRVFGGTWLAAGMLAGLAGVFFGSYRGADWIIGQSALFIAFPIVVLGGIGSIRGSVVAAYAIGFIEIGTITFLDPSMSGLIPFLLLIAILLARPQGLLGRSVEA